MKLTFLGATKTVTGSKYLIEKNNKNFLVDCGLLQGLIGLLPRNQKQLINKIFFLLLILILIPLNAWSNPHDLEIFNNDKFARPEMKNMCSVCHENPNGGGPRNAFGMAFEKNNEKITNDLRKKFPKLFDLLKAFSPRINRVKPSVFIVGQETQVVILGANFTNDSIVHIDSVSLESTPHIEHTVVSSKRIDLKVTFDKPSKHTFHIVSPLGQVSNVFKVVAKK